MELYFVLQFKLYALLLTSFYNLFFYQKWTQ